MLNKAIKIVLVLVILAGVAVAGVYWWKRLDSQGTPAGFLTGNGRMEATEINVSTKLAGRIEEMLVDEGDFVEAGQALVRMQTDVLVAQRAEAVVHSFSDTRSIRIP